MFSRLFSSRPKQQAHNVAEFDRVLITAKLLILSPVGQTPREIASDASQIVGRFVSVRTTVADLDYLERLAVAYQIDGRWHWSQSGSVDSDVIAEMADSRLAAIDR
ncbi:hypothetical protein LOC71_19195 [Rhodopirellula sp. JC740]|uniref:Uncharacterized protein n=1 Tax=Rhodopirellula halodulae TaxID=2894198 RepID=A0ABS8NLF8_9BACT|nr:hypothetical protein [Rhodopirellula sp. JC740]MCC9644404.1 hypothetical protein [Rhodopirellula sp. JC740]